MRAEIVKQLHLAITIPFQQTQRRGDAKDPLQHDQDYRDPMNKRPAAFDMLAGKNIISCILHRISSMGYFIMLNILRAAPLKICTTMYTYIQYTYVRKNWSDQEGFLHSQVLKVSYPHYLYQQCGFPSLMTLSKPLLTEKSQVAHYSQRNPMQQPSASFQSCHSFQHPLQILYITDICTIALATFTITNLLMLIFQLCKPIRFTGTAFWILTFSCNIYPMLH